MRNEARCGGDFRYRQSPGPAGVVASRVHRLIRFLSRRRHLGLPEARCSRTQFAPKARASAVSPCTPSRPLPYGIVTEAFRPQAANVYIKLTTPTTANSSGRFRLIRQLPHADRESSLRVRRNTGLRHAAEVVKKRRWADFLRPSEDRL
jgi:hypothetical protein